MQDQAQDDTSIQHLLLDWFERTARDLPWRDSCDPYHILTSEMMLQQTQVDRVVPKYIAFLETFPTIETLAAAPTAEVIRRWAGLGYNRRAVNLQRTARTVLEEYNGIFPQDPVTLQQLPGIGPYTAGAVACFAFGHDVAFLDTNMRRVITRCCLGNPTPPPRERDLLVLAKELIPAGKGWLWNQALIELGALVCSARSPACPQCPLNPICQAVQAPTSANITYQTSNPTSTRAKVAERKTVYRAPYKGSSRYYRGRIIAFLRDIPDESFATRAEIKAAVAEDEQHTDAWLHSLLDALVHDGLIEQDGVHVRLPRM